MLHHANLLRATLILRLISLSSTPAISHDSYVTFCVHLSVVQVGRMSTIVVVNRQTSVVKRPTGSTPFLFVVAFAAHALLCVPRLFGKKRSNNEDSSDVNKYKPVIGVTVGWLLLYFTFLFRQSLTAFKVFEFVKAHAPKRVGLEAVKYGQAGGKIMLEADRTVGNMVEQAVPFFVSLWAHARFVDPIRAAKLGWAWLAFRAIYPKVWGKIPWLFFSTLPG